MLPTGSWVAAKAGALAQQDANGLLCFPGREELLRYHLMEEKTCSRPDELSASAVLGTAVG